MSELSIKVVIGGRTYPLTINREDEEKIRKSVSEIENNIKNLKENYLSKKKYTVHYTQFQRVEIAAYKEIYAENLEEAEKIVASPPVRVWGV